MKIDKYKNNQDLVFSLFIFFIVIIFVWWSNPTLYPMLSPDSGDYIALSADLNSEYSGYRSFFLPLVIKFTKIISISYWPLIFSFIQISLHGLICILLFNFYLNFSFNKIVAAILVLIIGFNPSIAYYTNYLLAEHLLAVFTTLSWFFMNLFLKREKNIYYIILVGIFSGLAIATKPIFIFGIIPLLLTYFFISKKTLNMLKTILIILVINYSFYFSWEGYKKSINSTPAFRSIDQISLSVNMTALRAGLVEYGEGTNLYNFLEKNNLINVAKELKIKPTYTMDSDIDYLIIYNALRDSSILRYDKDFTSKILKHAPIRILMYSITNWHAFFTKRSFSPGEGSFPYMPNILRYFYNAGYAVLYRPGLLVLLILSIIILYKKKYLPLLISSLGIILYASLCIVILTPHGGEFPRYRVWIEYIMWFLALFPIGMFIEYLGQNKTFNKNK